MKEIYSRTDSIINSEENSGGEGSGRLLNNSAGRSADRHGRSYRMIFRRLMCAGAAVLLILGLAGGAGIAAGAASAGPQSGESGSITVTLKNSADSKPVSGAGLTLYKAADVKVDNGYKFQYKEAFEGAGDEPSADSELNEELAAELAEIAAEADESLGGISRKTGTDGKVSFTGLDAGLYLIVQSQKDGDGLTVDPFLVTVPDKNLNYNVDASPKVGKVTVKPAGRQPSGKKTSNHTAAAKLPQTGQLWWPVMVFGCAGIVFIAAGLIRRRNNKQ